MTRSGLLIGGGLRPRSLQRLLLPVAVLLILSLAFGCRHKTPMPHEGKSVAELRRMLASDQPRQQAQAALGLSLHGADAQEATGRLIELTRSADSLVRQQSALALGKIGPGAGRSAPDLIRLLDDADWPVRRQAALALGGLGQQERDILDSLKRREGDSHPLVQKAAREALARISASSTGSK